MFNAGFRPAINAGLSVSRVGGAAQTKIIKTWWWNTAGFSSISRIGSLCAVASGLDEATRKQLERGQRVMELMKQKQYSPMSVASMAVSLFAVENGFLDDVEMEKIGSFESALQDFIGSSYSDLVDRVNATGDYDDETEGHLKNALKTLRKLNLGKVELGKANKMAAGKEIRTKITSVKNTQKITKAMEMVAASKMRKAQKECLQLNPMRQIRDVITHVAKSKTNYHPFLEQREIGKIGVLIISTDRGLCGGLNGNLFRQSLKRFEEWEKEGKELQLSIVGNKGVNFFSRIGANIVIQVTQLGDTPNVEQLIGTIKLMVDEYLGGNLDRLYIVYNQFVNRMTQSPVFEQLLPLVPDDSDDLDYHWDYIYEPEAAEVLDDYFRDM